ncbi:MAG: helix-turn-helix domain-containing protein [Patescibacteria group bacterium]
MPTLEKNKLLSVNEVAELFGVHPETVRRWDNDGKLKAIRVGEGGHRKFRREEVERLFR